MIVQFPRQERAEETELSDPDGRAADLHAMGVMLGYLEAEATRLKLPRLVELISESMAELGRP